jgi:hypothetical protein
MNKEEEFSEINFPCSYKDDGHVSRCDIDTICPKCNSYYRKDAIYIFCLIPILIVGIFYFERIKRDYLPTLTGTLFVTLFILSLSFIGSILRNRIREFLTSLGILLSTMLLIVCVYGIDGMVPKFPKIGMIISFIIFFISFLVPMQRGYQDAKAIDKLSSFVILIIIINFVVAFLHFSMKVFVDLIFTEEIIFFLGYTEWILTFRIISACVIVLLLFVYSISKTIEQPVTSREFTSPKQEIFDKDFALFKAMKVISNIFVDSSNSIKKGADVVKQRIIICLKELINISYNSMFTMGLLLLRIFRFVIIVFTSIALSFSLRHSSSILGKLWISNEFFGISLLDWVSLLLLFLVMALLLYFLSLSSYKKWDNFSKESTLDSIFGSNQEASIATSSIVYSLTLYLACFLVIVFIGWFAINILESIIAGGWPKTLGFAFSFSIISTALIVVLFTQRVIDIEIIKEKVNILFSKLMNSLGKKD